LLGPRSLDILMVSVLDGRDDRPGERTYRGFT
jgi:hypothetical protein